MNIELLIKQAQEITASGLPFMVGKEKLDVDALLLKTLTVEEYGYMEGANEQSGEIEEYVVISIKGMDGFIYGSTVVTQAFKSLEEKFDDVNLKSLLDFGLTFKLSKLVSKNKRKYTKIDFFPS